MGPGSFGLHLACNYLYLLMMDYFSRFPKAIPLKSIQTPGVAQELVWFFCKGREYADGS